VQNGAVWAAAPADLEATLARAARGLAPRSVPKKVYATVDSRTVRNPRGWLALYTIGTPVARDPGGSWTVIYVSGVAPSPWTNGDSFRLSRRGPYLERNGRLFRLPATTARKLRARQPLA
jgi:hypothetical protein